MWGRVTALEPLDPPPPRDSNVLQITSIDQSNIPPIRGQNRDRYFENGEAYALPASIIGKDIDKAIEIGKARPTGGDEMLQFCVLTFNTQTLNGAENRTNIEQQLIDNKVLIAGFQESRSKKSGIKLSDSAKFVNVTSAKDGQGLGIEIWIASQ
jgi:hypothetical protein